MPTFILLYLSHAYSFPAISDLYLHPIYPYPFPRIFDLYLNPVLLDIDINFYFHNIHIQKRSHDRKTNIDIVIPIQIWYTHIRTVFAPIASLL